MPALYPVVEFAQLDTTDRRLHLGHTQVATKEIVHPAKAARRQASLLRCGVASTVVLEGPGLLPQGLRAGQQHAALAAGRDDLVLAEGEGGQVAERADRAAVDAGAMRLGTVLDHAQVVFGREFENRCHVAGPAGQVDDQDGPRTWGDSWPDRVSGQVLTVRLDIGEDLVSGPDVEHPNGEFQVPRCRLPAPPRG